MASDKQNTSAMADLKTIDVESAATTCSPPPQQLQEAPSDSNALQWALTLTSRIPFDDDGNMTSIGSIFHHQGGCRPCRFHHHPGKPEGCQYGVGCLFCHFHHDRRRRRGTERSKTPPVKPVLPTELAGMAAVQKMLMQSCPPQGSRIPMSVAEGCDVRPLPMADSAANVPQVWETSHMCPPPQPAGRGVGGAFPVVPPTSQLSRFPSALQQQQQILNGRPQPPAAPKVFPRQSSLLRLQQQHIPLGVNAPRGAAIPPPPSMPPAVGSLAYLPPAASRLPPSSPQNSGFGFELPVTKSHTLGILPHSRSPISPNFHPSAAPGSTASGGLCWAGNTSSSSPAVHFREAPSAASNSESMPATQLYGRMLHERAEPPPNPQYGVAAGTASAVSAFVLSPTAASSGFCEVSGAAGRHSTAPKKKRDSLTAPLGMSPRFRKRDSDCSCTSVSSRGSSNSCFNRFQSSARSSIFAQDSLWDCNHPSRSSLDASFLRLQCNMMSKTSSLGQASTVVGDDTPLHCHAVERAGWGASQSPAIGCVAAPDDMPPVSLPPLSADVSERVSADSHRDLLTAIIAPLLSSVAASSSSPAAAAVMSASTLRSDAPPFAPCVHPPSPSVTGLDLSSLWESPLLLSATSQQH